MAHIRQYLLTIVAAAIFCSVITTLLGKKSAVGGVIKLLTGLFLAITVVAPWAKLEVLDFSAYTGSLTQQGEDIASSGQAAANAEISSIIKSRAEAYILDKAADLGLELAVTVTVSGSDPPRLTAVTLQGAAAPYAKQRLRQVIAQDLGIPEEKQTWT